MASWPITTTDLKTALGIRADQQPAPDPEELELFTTAACERIDEHTGRAADPTRHLKADGTLPVIFRLAARETAKLWWQQTKNGRRGAPSDPDTQLDGPPMGADLPRKVEGWLAPYPPPPGIA